jgi:hypothetical protein
MKSRTGVTADVKETIASLNEEATFADGFEDALIGYVERFGVSPVPLYDREVCIQILIDQGFTHEDAEEYFNYNVTGAWVGDGTPAFATILRETRCDL